VDSGLRQAPYVCVLYVCVKHKGRDPFPPFPRGRIPQRPLGPIILFGCRARARSLSERLVCRGQRRRNMVQMGSTSSKVRCFANVPPWTRAIARTLVRTGPTYSFWRWPRAPLDDQSLTSSPPPHSMPPLATEIPKSRWVYPWENQAVWLNTNLLPSTGYHGFLEGHHIRKKSHFIQKDSELMT
jgi:hypothetical protein